MIKFNIRGSECKERNFVSLQAWNITVNLEASLANASEMPADDSSADELPF